ncbi:MAG: hypothetical protein A3E83_03920 [Gammaproteobacteria bacterium RIFCSPHIGHO2_12_FULL_41_20]|nr:MAG: hypothetical protein A3E83_03920 [Gammaproteobacteria bacterium RIFCSPHIGHO2_12_FULL_41_20]
MWERLRSIAGATTRTIKKVATHVKDIFVAIPRSIKKIIYDDNVRFAFKNIISLNVLRFLLPWAILSYCKKHLFTLATYELGIPSSATDVIETLVDYTIMSLILIRMRLQLMALNAAVTTGGAGEIGNAFSQTPQSATHPLCQDCSTKERFLDGIAGQLHFILSYLTIWGSKVILGETLGPWTAFLFRCYADGFFSYQYGVAEQRICSSHQIAVLTQERTRCFSLGLVLQLLSQLPTRALALAGMPVGSEVQLTWDNLLMLFGILHAHTLTLTPPTQLPQPDNKTLLDPLVLSWHASRGTIQGISWFGKIFIRYESEHPNTFAPRIRALHNSISSLSHASSSHPVLNMIARLVLPKQVRSLKAYAEDPSVRPYAQLAIARLESIIQAIKEISSLMVLRTVRSLVRNSWTGYTVSRAGKWYLRSLRGWPEDVLDLLILACKIPHLTQRLGDLLTYLRSINPNPYVEFWSGKPPLLIEQHVTDQSTASHDNAAANAAADTRNSTHITALVTTATNSPTPSSTQEIPQPRNGHASPPPPLDLFARIDMNRFGHSTAMEARQKPAETSSTALPIEIHHDEPAASASQGPQIIEDYIPKPPIPAPTVYRRRRFR